MWSAVVGQLFVLGVAVWSVLPPAFYNGISSNSSPSYADNRALYQIDPGCSNTTTQEAFFANQWQWHFTPALLEGGCRVSESRSLIWFLVVVPIGLISLLFSSKFLAPWYCQGMRCAPSQVVPTKQQIITWISAFPCLTVFITGIVVNSIVFTGTAWDWCIPISSSLGERMPWVKFWQLTVWLDYPEAITDPLKMLIQGGCVNVQTDTLYFSDKLIGIQAALNPTRYLQDQLANAQTKTLHPWIIMVVLCTVFFIVQLIIASRCAASPNYEPVQPQPQDAHVGHQQDLPPAASDPAAAVYGRDPESDAILSSTIPTGTVPDAEARPPTFTIFTIE